MAANNHSDKVLVEMGWNTNFLLAPEHAAALMKIINTARRYESEYLDGAQLIVLGPPPPCTIKSQGTANYIIVDRLEHGDETIDEYKQLYRTTAALKGDVQGTVITFESFLEGRPTTTKE